MKSPKFNPIRLKEITPYVDLVIDGEAWKAIEPLPGVGWELANKARPKERRFLTTAEYDELKAAERVVLVSEVQSFASLAALTDLQRSTAFIRSFWMEVVDVALDNGTLTRLSRGKVRVLINDNAELVATRWRAHKEENDFDHGKAGRKKRFASIGDKKPEPGDVNRERLFPCPETLIALYEKWVRAKRDFWSLVPNANAHNQGGKPIDTRTWQMLLTHTPKFAGEKEATLNSICEKVNIEIMLTNATLGEDNAIPLASTYGVGLALQELPEAIVVGGRLGKKRLRQQLAHVGKGPEYKRVGEMTLHDCWSTHVLTLIPTAAKHLFDEDELHTRVVLAAVQDVASGAIVGFTHGISESANLVRAAYRMAMTDKTAIARAAGCISAWDMRIGIEEVKSDSGPAYRSEGFMGSVYSISDRLTFTAAGRANLRGKIERVFQAMDVDFIRRITGRTGSNVMDRGRDEQDPAKRASLFVDQFMKLLTRYIVDVLHYRRPQKGGLSPARKFEAITSRIQCKAPPTPEEMRVAFGVLTERTLNRAGIRFMNISYYSGWLDIVLQNRGECDLPIRVDVADLGCISVLIGSDWTTIQGPREMQGVSLDEWLARQQELARRYGEQARLDFAQFVAPALIDIEREAKRAEDFFNLENVYWTADMMEQVEKDLRVFVLYDRDPEGSEDALTIDSSKLGSVRGRTPMSPSEAAAPSLPAIAPQTHSTPPERESAAQSEPVVLMRKRNKKKDS